MEKNGTKCKKRQKKMAKMEKNGKNGKKKWQKWQKMAKKWQKKLEYQKKNPADNPVVGATADFSPLA